MYEATIQVLAALGGERLTTTRVAERAGVSVGTLYQYFPNKQSLLAAVLARHLSQVVDVVQAACEARKGRPVAEMAAGIVDAFVDAKFADPDASRALYGVAAELDGQAVVARSAHRAQLAVCEMLATAPDFRSNAIATVALVVSTALIGPVQALLESGAGPAAVQAVRGQLVTLVGSYLSAAGAAGRRTEGRSGRRRSA